MSARVESRLVTINGSDFAVTHEHRGGLATDPELWPDRELFTRAGGAHVIEALVDDLYARISRDPELSRVFPHFYTHNIKPFFVTSLGGSRPHKGASALGPFHRQTIVTPALAGRWLANMQDALQASPIDEGTSQEIMAWLRPLAKRLVNTPNQTFSDEELIRGCDGVQTPRYCKRVELLTAAAAGKLSVIEEAVENDPQSVSFQNENGRSLLWEAVNKSRAAVVDYLVERGADVNLPGCDPPVINLACSGKARVGTGFLVSPLALAIRRRRDKIARRLASAGAVRDIFSVAWLGDVDAVRGAIEFDGELVHAEDPAEDFKRVTPLHHATAAAEYGAAKLLIDAGARVEPHSRHLLTLAALHNRVDLVRLLLDSGADVHRVNVLGPLDCEERPVADLLVARGFDINADSNFGALLVRACRGDVSNHESSRVQTLLRYGADVNQSHYGMTPLHYAARTGRIPLIQLLLDHGADVDRPDNEGLTPLSHLAKTRAKADPLPVLQILHDHGADLDSRNDKGESILFFFARRGNQEAVRWLLENGANRGQTNNRGKSAEDIIKNKAGSSFDEIRRLLREPSSD